MTKEAKLTAAMRIVSEWKDYDNEIKRLQIKQSKHEDEVFNDETQSKGNLMARHFVINVHYIIIVDNYFIHVHICIFSHFIYNDITSM